MNGSTLEDILSVFSGAGCPVSAAWRDKDAKGRPVTVKLVVAPSGDLDEADNWLDAAEHGVTASGKAAGGKGVVRGGSPKDAARGESGREALALLMGKAGKPKRRTGKADTIDAANGQPVS